MPTVTGEFTTVHGGNFPAGAQPLVEFVPSKPAVTVGGHLISTSSQEVIPSPTDRTFSVNLVATVDVIDADFHYTVRGSYLEPTGYGTSGYNKVDVFEHKIYVPTEGGNIGALAKQPGRPFESWVFVDPTWSDTVQPSVIIPGAYYLSAHVSDPDLGTGDLWKAVA